MLSPPPNHHHRKPRRLYTCLDLYKNAICIPQSTYREGHATTARLKREQLLDILDHVAAIPNPRAVLKSPLAPASCGHVKAAVESLVNEAKAKLKVSVNPKSGCL